MALPRNLGIHENPLDPEPVPLAQLRDYTRLSARRTGLFSADLWTLASTYLRNLLLNWLVLLPLIAAVICIPRILPPLIGVCLPTWLAWLLLCVGVALQCYGMGFMAWNRMVHKRHRINTQKGFIFFCLIELVLAAFLITFVWPSLEKTPVFNSAFGRSGNGSRLPAPSGLLRRAQQASSLFTLDRLPIARV